MTSTLHRAFALIIAASLTGADRTQAQTSESGSISGTYSVTKQVAESTCGHTVQLPDATARVAHQDGAESFTLNDAGITFRGSLAAGRSFRTEQVRGQNPDGWTLSVVLAGRFTDSGFEAQLLVAAERPANAGGCRYA